MAAHATDPVRQFEHSHASLTELVAEIGRLVRAKPMARRSTSRLPTQLVGRLGLLRDELLQHFADEEEGLFPFVRLNMPAKSAAVERLADAHDAICGTIVRLVHLAQHDRKGRGPSPSTLVSHYERFENAYAEHARQEAALFEELGIALDEPNRAQLAELLRGL